MKRTLRREVRPKSPMWSSGALATIAFAGALPSCATSVPESPSDPVARATAHWSWYSNGRENDGDPDLMIWSWALSIAVPDDDLECELAFDSDPKLVEGGWIDYRPEVFVTRSGGLAGRGHSILWCLSPAETDLVTPRPYYLIDNPGMRFRWVAPSEPPPIAPPPPSLPEPPNCEVPRAVVDRLASLRSSHRQNWISIPSDDVVMKWAIPYLRSELSKSAVNPAGFHATFLEIDR